MYISVIIPVYNKSAVISETLEALSCQLLPAGEFEVIIVDDGSVDGTLEFIRSIDPPYPLSILNQPNLGAGAARNAGARVARSDLLLFMDADIVASSELLLAHLEAHQNMEASLVIGRIQQWSKCEVSPSYEVFSRIFDFGSEPRHVSFGIGLTQNLSLAASQYASLGGFDESLPRGQDLDFSYRAINAGFHLFYHPLALAYHNHPMSLESLCEKTFDDHEKLVLLFQKYPELIRELDYLADKWPIFWGIDSFEMITRKLIRYGFAFAPVRFVMRGSCRLLENVFPNPSLLNFLVWKTLASYQLLGLRAGIRRYHWNPRLYAVRTN